MLRIALITVLPTLFSLLLPTNISATTDPCNDIYIVYPGSNEGGTFYLKLEQDPKSKRFEREGYIQAMTLIKIVRENGFVKERIISEGKGETKYPYVEFVGSDGSFGYIKRTSITPLKSLLKYKDQKLSCNSPYKLVIPISPTEDVTLFNKPKDKTETPKKIGSFSRSAFDIVYTDENVDDWDNADHTGKIPFYNVKFSQEQQGGAFIEREALIRVKGEDEIYRLFPINPGNYRQVKMVTDENTLSKLKRLFSRCLADYDSNELARGLKKSCDEELSFEVKINLGVEVPINIVKIGAGAEAKYFINYAKGYRYTLDTYHGFLSDTKSDVLKTVRCEENSTTDWYSHRLLITEIGKGKDAFEAFQHQLERRLKAYFEKPDTTGFAGIKRDKMLVLKKIKMDSGKDYFSAFSKLDKYLDERFFNEVLIGAVEKLQFKSLIMRLIVDCD